MQHRNSHPHAGLTGSFTRGSAHDSMHESKASGPSIRTRTKVSTLAQAGRSQKSGRKRSQGCFSMSSVGSIGSITALSSRILPVVDRIKLSKKYCVYVDMTDELVSLPYYVGFGCERRVNNLSRNAFHDRVAAKHGLRRYIIAETDFKHYALSLERFYVLAFGTYHVGSYIGTNLTLGGEDSPMKDPVVAKKVSATKMGHVTSNETKRKIGEAVRKAHADPDVWQKMSDASSRRRHSLETREKMKQSHKRRAPISEETRQRIKTAATAREKAKRAQTALAALAGAAVTTSTSDVYK